MIEAFQRQPLIAALALAAAGLAVAVGVETGFGTRIAPVIPSGPSKAAAPFQAKLLPPIAPVDAEQAYTEMVARPLFIALRRPAPPAEASAAAAMKRGEYVLQGVTIAGGTRIALLREKATGKVHRVEKGHDLDGIKVAEITPESVTLAQGSEQEVLPLQVIKPAASPGAAAQVGPFGPATAAGAMAPPAAGAVPGNPAHAPSPPPPPPTTRFGPAPVTPQQPNAHPNAVPQATTAPLTPEELLARRRARRAQQSQ
jgi:hypothetical protein